MSLHSYSTIVVGTDGSSLAEPTVARAALLAAREDADLVIVCAFTPATRRQTAKSRAALSGLAGTERVPGEVSAGLALEEALGYAKEQGARVAAAQLVDGDPADALLHVVAERSADLLVVGAIHDRSVADRLLGTVADEVVRKAPCEVLIVRPQGAGPVVGRPEDVAGTR